MEDTEIRLKNYIHLILYNVQKHTLEKNPVMLENWVSIVEDLN
jgi:hypothetical protein